MTKEQDRRSHWEDSYNNKTLSGIEVRDKQGKLVNFITICHDALLEKNQIHRITIRLNEDSKPILPAPQTFEEIIQAKRRQQMLLYGSGNSSSAVLTDRAARRVAAAARQTLPRPNLARRTIASISRRPTSSKTKKRSKPRPPAPTKPTTEASLPPVQSKSKPSEPVEQVQEPVASTSSQVVTSMKDLTKHNPLLKSVDPKEVKLLLKSAPPGASIVLPNGTVIKKSRRGGARVGAGRKRSRPLPSGQSSRSQNGNQASANNSSSFSSQAS